MKRNARIRLDLDELQAATIAAALTFFAEAMDADDERRGPRFLPFQCVDGNIGCLTTEEIREFQREHGLEIDN